jgi:hypothetical protein
MTWSNKEIIWAASIVVWNPNTAAEETLYVANRNAFTVSGGAAETQFSIRLSQPTIAARTAFADHATSGRGVVSKGLVKLDNAGGVFDQYRTYGFDGRDITIYLGQTDDLFPDDFQTVLSATMESAVFGQEEVTVKLRDWQRATVAPLQTTLYAGDNVLPDGLEGTADLAGKPKPVLYGKVRNAEPVCVNTSKLIYQIADSAIETIDAVYDSGVALNQGLQWVKHTSPFTSSGDKLNGGTFGGGTWVAVGDNNIGPSPLVATSSDGVTWTSRTMTGFSGQAVLGAAYGNSVFVAFGTGTKLSSSSDGVTWTARTSGFTSSASIHAGCYSTDLALFVVVGDQGQISTSPDGTTWTAQTSGTSHTFIAVTFGNGVFVAVTDAAEIVTSRDGATWTARTTNLSNASFKGVAFVESVGFVVAGFDNTNSDGRIGSSAFSVDGITWTLTAPIGGTSSILAVTASDSTFFAATDDGKLVSSVDGQTWTITDVFAKSGGGGASINALVPDGSGVFVVLGDDTTGAGVWRSAASQVYADPTDLQDDTLAPEAGSWIACYDASGAYVRLGSSPAGRITCDASHGATAADRTAAQLAVAVLGRAGFVSGDWSASDVTTLDTVNDAECGYFTTEGDQVISADVIDQLMGSVGAWWSTDQSGVIRFKRLDAAVSNLTSHPSDLATSPWAVAGGSPVATNAFAVHAGHSFSRVTAADTGPIRQAVTLPADGTYYVRALVRTNGVTGTIVVAGFYDDTATTIRAQATVTVASDGSMTGVATFGTLVALTAIGDGVYSVLMKAASAVAAHTNYVYATFGGTATSLLISDVECWQGDPDARLTQDTDMDGMQHVPSADANGGLPCSRTVVRYSKNYAPLTGTDVAFGVSDADRATFAKPWLDTGTSVDSNITTAHPLAVQRLDETLLADETDASDEATRRQALFGADHFWFDVPVYLTDVTAAIDLGDIVELASTRYGMGAGTRGVVLGVKPDAAANRVTLSVWV